MTGELPGSGSTTDTPPPAESAPAPPSDSAASTDASTPAASESATSSETTSKAPGKKNAETRKAELQAEIDALLKQRHQLRQEIDTAPRQPAPPAPTPDAGPTTLAQAIARPDVERPALSEGAFFAAYPEAQIGDYARYVARYELVADRVQSETRAAIRQRSEAFTAKLPGPDFWTTIDPRLGQLNPIDILPPDVTPGPLNYLAQEIVTADNPAALLTHLSANADALLARFARMSPGQIAREIGRLEATLAAPPKMNPEPPVNVTSAAPAPPPTLGHKPAVPADEVDAAIASGDFARYRAAQNRLEMSAQR